MRFGAAAFPTFPSLSGAHPAPHAEKPSAGRRLEARTSPSPSDRLAGLAVSALIAEATLAPKPGLVDARGAGAHADVELRDFLASAEALRPTFATLARAAEGREPSQALREELAAIGRAGETAMLAATGGANTHRGAIWALGLIVAGAAVLGARATPEAICALASAIARFEDRHAPNVELNGARACRIHGVSGARGEAAAGFPHALDALAALRTGRRRGGDETACRIDALLTIMTSLDDTCLLHRGGRRALRVARLGARAALSAGGAGTAAGMEALIALDRRLLALNASPGGAADVLAAALLLDAIDKGRHPGRSPRVLPSASPRTGYAESRDRAPDMALNPDDDPGSALCAVRDDDMQGDAGRNDAGREG